MQMKEEDVYKVEQELIRAAKEQDEYDLSTLCLIAPACPTPLKYIHDLPLKYNDIAEGLLGKRPYAGVEGFNKIESIAANMACELFGAEHANVQPHSVSQANQAVYQALLNHGDQVLAMRFDAGGHLTHGMSKNFSGIFYKFDFYGVDQDGIIDYDEMERLAERLKPKLIICGASSYPRDIDFERISTIAKSVDAYLLADVSHPAGFIVADRFSQPFPHCDVVTLTLDKTMLGPHGGILLCKSELAELMDRSVHPGVQSSVPLRRIYEMAQCMVDCRKSDFHDFIDRIILNMKAFEEGFSRKPNLMVTGGSSSNLMVLDTFNTFGVTGKEVEELLEGIGILTNRQMIPLDTQKPYVASGIRLGTTWITARGYSEEESRKIAMIIYEILGDQTNRDLLDSSKREISNLIKKEREKDVWSEK